MKTIGNFFFNRIQPEPVLEMREPSSERLEVVEIPIDKIVAVIVKNQL